MAVKKEDVLAKATELNLTLTDEQVNVMVAANVLPSAPPTDDSDDDDDDQDDDPNEGKTRAQRRIKKLAADRKALRAQLEEAEKKAKEFEDEKKKQSQKTDAEKGNYEKLSTELAAEKEKVAKALSQIKDRARDSAIRNTIRDALRDAGCPKDRLAKAERLFEIEKVDFEWIDEDKLEYEIDADTVSDLVTSFKKDNDFLFEGSGDDEGGDDGKGSRDNADVRFAKPPKTGQGKAGEQEKNLRSMFSALR